MQALFGLLGFCIGHFQLLQHRAEVLLHLGVDQLHGRFEQLGNAAQELSLYSGTANSAFSGSYRKPWILPDTGLWR